MTSIDILNSYIEGKDRDKYKILESIYAENATVEFEINSKNIRFPSEISGNRAIAKTLSADFNKTYENVKTYYLSFPEPGQMHITGQKWLVIMQEIQTGHTRVGAGYYNWTLSHGRHELKIQAHKIYIHDMIVLADPHAGLLNALQEILPYPWAGKEAAIPAITEFPELRQITAYLKE